MRILLDGVPFGVPGIHFDSHANIIVTNGKLQASRWIPSRPPLPRIVHEDKALACSQQCAGRSLVKVGGTWDPLCWYGNTEPSLGRTRKARDWMASIPFLGMKVVVLRNESNIRLAIATHHETESL
jgi:hypothetical protein